MLVDVLSAVLLMTAIVSQFMIGSQYYWSYKDYRQTKESRKALFGLSSSSLAVGVYLASQLFKYWIDATIFEVASLMTIVVMSAIFVTRSRKMVTVCHEQNADETSFASLKDMDPICQQRPSVESEMRSIQKRQDLHHGINGS